MATNRNAIIRYNTLDKCFRNFGRKYYFEDLIDEVNSALQDFDPNCKGIKTRQLRDDIRFMKSEAGYAAPIEAFLENKKAYYRYTDKKYSINNSPLNVTEAEQLKNAIAILHRFDGAPQFEWVSEITPMLSSRFGLDKSENKVIFYETNLDYTGHERIIPLFNAIVNKKVLEIEYQPFEKDVYAIIFHPYCLKQFNNRWFVYGLNEKLNIPTWNLALDRIINISDASVKYKNTDIDWEDYFYDIIGVTMPMNGVKQNVKLIFNKEQAQYIDTKPLHPSQKNRFLDNGELEVRLEIFINYELEMLILSFGEKVKVVEPQELKARIKERIASSLKNYF